MSSIDTAIAHVHKIMKVHNVKSNGHTLDLFENNNADTMCTHTMAYTYQLLQCSCMLNLAALTFCFFLCLLFSPRSRP